MGRRLEQASISKDVKLIRKHEKSYLASFVSKRIDKKTIKIYISIYSSKNPNLTV